MATRTCNQPSCNEWPQLKRTSGGQLNAMRNNLEWYKAQLKQRKERGDNSKQTTRSEERKGTNKGGKQE